MSTHGTGCYTSINSMKRWNRHNELLADATERASVVADWLGGIEYPTESLREAWELFIWHQFHDDLTGTSIPEAYEFSWNDEIIALNRFSSMLTDAAGAVSRILDTRAEGQPLVVYNPLAFERSDIVEAEVPFPEGAPAHVRVFGPDGAEVLAQVVMNTDNAVRVAFQATILPVGFAVFDVRPSNSPCAMDTGLSASSNSLENGRYRVRFDANGDVASITDKASGRELLDKPVRLALFDNYSPVWPAWEITYETVSASPVDHVGGPARMRVVESGPARVSIEIERKAGLSTFTQTVSLAAGSAGDRVEFDHVIDWRSKERLLKAVFPLNAANPVATYDLGLGVIERGNNTERLYEVPAQQWADITDAGGGHGVTIMNDCLYGWDKPGDNTLRLTMLHTPRTRSYADQAMQDIGRHRMSFAISGHADDWRKGDAVRQAARFNSKLTAFTAPEHEGERGKSFSFLRTNAPTIAVKALKMAEESDEIILRINETEGANWDNLQYAFPLPIVSAREVNGAEEPLGPATVENGVLVTSLAPWQPRTFALRLDRPDTALSIKSGKPLELSFDIDAVSFDDDRGDGDLDGRGRTIPAELLPDVLRREGVLYTIGPKENGAANALACRGQTLPLPVKPRMNSYNRLHILAAAIRGDQEGTFTVGDRTTTLNINNFTGFVGQWDNRLVNGAQVSNPFQVKPGFIKRDDIAWTGTHRHDRENGNEAYVFTYLFHYAIDLERGDSAVTLPDNDNILIFAMTAAVDWNAETEPAHHLYDAIEATSVAALSNTGGYYFIDSASVTLEPTPPGAEIHYTLDGSDPDRNDPVYSSPLTINGDTTIKARAFKDGFDDVRLMIADFARLDSRRGIRGDDMRSGVRYRIFEGDWDVLPDFNTLNAVKSGIAQWFGIPDGAPDDHFAVYLSGYIHAPRDGIYTFY